MVYIKYWERFLIWGGHHCIEEDYNEAKQYIEATAELYYIYGERLQNSSVDETDKKRGTIQNKAETALRRASQHRDILEQENLLQMICRIKNPLLALPKHIDEQHYLKSCPNAVIDLRTGELRPGKPEQYILNSIVTDYDPALLEVPDPCPETNKFLLRSMNGDQEVVDLFGVF